MLFLFPRSVSLQTTITYFFYLVCAPYLHALCPHRPFLVTIVAFCEDTDRGLSTKSSPWFASPSPWSVSPQTTYQLSQLKTYPCNVLICHIHPHHFHKILPMTNYIPQDILPNSNVLVKDLNEYN